MAVDLVLSNGNLVNTLSQGVAGFSAQIKYQTGLAEPDNDLLHNLKALYETEKQRLEDAWNKIREKGEDFLKEVLVVVKDFFEELVADLLKFLQKHGLQAIVDFIKDLFS